MEELKKCRACQEEKPLQQFHKSKGCRGGHSRTCKACFYNRYKEKSLKQNKEKYRENPQKHKDAAKKYREDNREKVKLIKKRPWYKISARIRERINDWLKAHNLPHGFKLPFSLKQLREFLEPKMRKNMTWDNYGEWCTDHIKPLYCWNLADEKERREANQLENLQCLWLKENEYKSKNYDPDHPMGWHGLNELLSDEDKKVLSEKHNYNFGQNKTGDSQI